MKFFTLSVSMFILGAFVSGIYLTSPLNENEGKSDKNNLLIEDLALQLEELNNNVKNNGVIIESFKSHLTYRANHKLESTDIKDTNFRPFDDKQINEIRNIVDEYSEFQKKYFDESFENLEISLNRTIEDMVSPIHSQTPSSEIRTINPKEVTEEQVVQLDEFLDEVEYIDLFSSEENGLPDYLNKVMSAGLNPIQLEAINDKLMRMSRENQL